MTRRRRCAKVSRRCWRRSASAGDRNGTAKHRKDNEQMALLITNARVVTWDDPNRIIENGAVLIEGERIAAVGPASELEAQHPEAERIDARGQLAMPGSICAHTHFYGAYSRGLAIPG